MILVRSAKFASKMSKFSDSDSEGKVSSLEFSSESDDFEMFASASLAVRKSLADDYVMSEQEVEFLSFHRISRHNYWRLIRLFKKSPYFSQHINGSHGRLEPTDQLTAFLRFACHSSSSYREVCRSFQISLSSLHRIINRFTYCFSNMSGLVFNWMTPTEINMTERYFRQMGLPGVIGVLGCGHIQIDRPFSGSESYLNSDGRYSIQIQIVSDHTCRIIDVFIGYPGAAKPVEVFHASPLSEGIEKLCISGAYRILADVEYSGIPNLLTPHQGELNEAKLSFNRLHHKCLFSIHKCFALLFMKFRHLDHVKLRNLGVVTNFVRACCVLHNLTHTDRLLPGDDERLINNALLRHANSQGTQPSTPLVRAKRQ